MNWESGISQKESLVRKSRFLVKFCSDEVEESTEIQCRRETFILAIESTVSSLFRKRFTSREEIIADFALLDAEKFADMRSTKDVP